MLACGAAQANKMVEGVAFWEWVRGRGREGD